MEHHDSHIKKFDQYILSHWLTNCVCGYPDDELEPTADEMEEWDYERRQKLARDLEY